MIDFTTTTCVSVCVCLCVCVCVCVCSVIVYYFTPRNLKKIDQDIQIYDGDLNCDFL